METIGVESSEAAGLRAGAHMPAYRAMANEGVKIVAVSDVSEEAARQAAAEFDVPHVYHDYRQLLERDDIAAVSVCTPNFLHKQPTIDSLQAGKHVLVEKPLAMNAEEGRAMVEAARRSGKKMQVGFMQRFGGGPQALKRFIDAGEMGEIYYARAQALRRRGIPGLGRLHPEGQAGRRAAGGHRRPYPRPDALADGPPEAGQRLGKDVH